MRSLMSKCKYRGLKFLMLCAVVCAAGAVAAANSDVDGIVDSNAAPGRKSLEERLAKRICIEFRKTAIEDVLRIIADQADVDIVKSPKVVGEVTVTLTDVPLEEALSNILSVHGFTHVLSENMIRVITSEERTEQTEKPEVLQTKTFEIVYADVTEVVKALEKFKSAKGSVSPIMGTSYIIITDTEAKVREITLFLQKIDMMTPQILVEARIYDVTSKESFDIEVNWDLARNVPITEVSQTDTRTKTDTETGPTNTYETTVTETVDTGTPANDGTVTVTETTTKPKTTGYGVTDTDTITKSTSKSWRTDSSGDALLYRKSRPFFGGSFDKTQGGVLRFGLLNDTVDLDLAISMIRKQVGAKLLANPRILVLDNEKAVFKAIREIPYQELTETSMGGNIGTTAFREVGVELEVTAHVARADNMIRLLLKPTFSVEGEDIDIAGATGIYKQPSVDRRQAETTLLVRSGETVVLAGMRKKEISQDIRKVPILGDLPLLKKLFRYESEEEITSELVVFVTPTIVRQTVLAGDEKQAYGATNFKGPKHFVTKIEKKAQAQE